MAASVSFSGIASGIDTDALIDVAISSKRALRVEPLQDKISETEDESSAIQTLKDKLLDLKNKLSKYNSLSGGAIKKGAISSDETIISAIASNISNQGSYDIQVSSLAKRGLFTFGTRYSSQHDKVAPDATEVQEISISIGLGDNKKSYTLEIDSDTTLSDLVDKINASNIGCEAVCVNVGTSEVPSYTVMLSALNEGKTKGFVDISTSSTDTDIIALVDNGTLSQAQNAIFSISGLASDIERDTNTISDTIPGVTFALQSVGSATISISNDLDSTQANVQEIVDVLNDIFKFVSDNNKVERREEGENVENIFSPLSKTKVDNNAVQSIKAALVATKESEGTQVRIFADFGITTNSRDGTLNFDIEKFSEAFSKEPSSIDSLLTKFSDTLSATGGTIDQYTRFSGLLDVVVNNNANQISDYNDRIAKYEAMLVREENNLRAMYSRFESLMSKLQSSSNSLMSMLGNTNSRQ
ncbi:MAG: flagellar filament capping protein FliD [Bdellovibrionota bacterium]